MKKPKTKKSGVIAGAKAKKKVEKKVEKAEDMLSIDYPKNNEVIPAGAGYTVRISASECEALELSINGGEWNPCRNASGYWWFDWDEIEPGSYQLCARMIKADGGELVSKRRRCKIA